MMKRMKNSTLRIGVLLAGAAFFLLPQAEAQVKGTKYTFTDTKKLDVTPVKNQCRTGTCWSFSTSSFIESELLRMGKGQYDLSEMFVVRNAYEEKAERYVKMHGKINFGEGGEFHDVMRIAKEKGIVPQSVYPGKVGTDSIYRHGELESVLESMLKAIIANPDGKLSPYWHDAVTGVLDAYLGKVPETFMYNGKQYTPKSFAKFLGIEPDEYVEITSVTDHPVNQQFINEIEDNWHWDNIYNVSLDDMKEIISNSVSSGYTVAWGADVSDPGFDFKRGIAIVPDLDWDTLPRDKRDSVLINPSKQKVITADYRQIGLDNYATTDDHGMQIVGSATDQLGDKFYIVKNSWGTKLNKLNGYFYASESYVLAKTTGFMVNKKAIPKSIAKKLGI
jgi:bleomycin hydrolase